MTYRDLSESQANAEALTRRSNPYTEASEASIRLHWSERTYDGYSLRDLVRAARAAYADEVPDKLHDSALADDGTPRMSSQAVGYIFGSAFSSDAKSDEMVSYYHRPFRATLERLTRTGGPEGERRRAAIVAHITIGSQGPVEAAMQEDVPRWCAKLVAEDALRSFLRGMTDLKLHVQRSQEADSAVA